MPDDWDDAEWDRWMSLTDEQQEAGIDREMRKYEKMVGGMSVIEYYRHTRRNNVRLCLSNRKHVREFGGLEIFQKMLRSAQLRLVKAREFRRTGIWPGEA